MNKLEEVIIDNYRRVRSSNSNTAALLKDAEGEILEVASPELTEQIILGSRKNDAARQVAQTHRHGITRIFRSQVTTESSKDSVLSDCLSVVSEAMANARGAVLKLNQGYIGGIIIEQSDVVIYGDNILEDKTPRNCIIRKDEYQEAVKDEIPFYPPTIWAKALRAVAYLKRPKSAESLTIIQYLTDLGFGLGSFAVTDELFVGASGFMHGKNLRGSWDEPIVDEYIASEPRLPVRLSGLCDQIAVDPGVIKPLLLPTSFIHGAFEGTHIRDIALDVIKNGGSLN